MYKIKQQPEDFIVKELSDIKPFSEKDAKDKDGYPIGSFDYFVFKLTKKNYSTLKACEIIANKLNIPLKNIGYAGLKDKKAFTEQLITIKKERLVVKDKILQLNLKTFHLQNKKIHLEFLGYLDMPISLGDLIGNSFEIVVRNLEKIEKIKTKSPENIINYFDEQRFSKNNAKVGKFLVKKEFESATKLIDTGKNIIITKHLEEKPNDFVGALNKLPRKQLMILLHAYQSWLWNEAVAEFIKNKFEKEKLKSIKYSLGGFVFPDEKIENIKIPIIGFGMELDEYDKDIKNIITDLMKKENVCERDFIIKQLHNLSCEGDERDLLINIKDFSVSELESDELNKNKNKCLVKFSLAKGSYATIVIKRLFS